VFVCIGNKVPLLLRLIMDFVGTGAEAAELKEVVNAIQSENWEFLHTCFGESSFEEIEDACSRERTVSGRKNHEGAYSSPRGWALNET
jgi:hypothetical protein